MTRIIQISLIMVSLWVLGGYSGFSQEIVAEFELVDEGAAGINVPVTVILKSGIIAQGSAYQLFEVDGSEKTKVSSQIRYGESDELSWVFKSNGYGIRNYIMTVAKRGNNIPIMSSNINDTTIIISKNQKPILHYRHALLPPPFGKGDKWARSGFIHPLLSPSGEVLTWAQPPDHFHHVGLWNPWTRVSWQGHNTDFWNLGDEQGTVRFKNIIGTESGAVFSEFRVVQDHVAFLKETPETVVMTEEWIIRVWNISEGYFLDFTSIITNVTNDTVSLDAYRYGGGLGFRATERWNNTNSEVLTSEGKTWKDGDATRADWCRVSGDLNGTETGLLFMSDPGNFDSPQPMRIWPIDSNGGIGHQYFEFTPIREKAWILESGKSYSQRYRVWVQEGGMEPETADAAWQAYSNYPDIKISYINLP